MKKWVLCYAILMICFLAAMTLDAAERSQTNPSTHHFNLQCDKCHISESDKKIQGQLAETWKLKEDINKSCTLSKCHNFDPMLNHPVGVKPKGLIPEDMPLDDNSNITCLTCHKESVDKNDYDYSDIDTGNKYLLRRPVGEQFCGSCHINLNSMSAGHWLFSTRAHLQTSDDKSSASNELDRSLKTIDQESRICLTCHDDITTSMPFGTGRLKQMTSHPIGMDYAYTTLQKNNYNINVSGDNSRIRLFNGKLGCGSCHSLYAETKYYLVANSKDSTLCRKCHDL